MKLSEFSTDEINQELVRRGVVRELLASQQGKWPHKVYEYHLRCPQCDVTAWGSWFCPRCGTRREWPK